MGDIPRPDEATSVPRSERDENAEPPANAGEVTENVDRKEVPLDKPVDTEVDLTVTIGNEKLIMIRLLAAINHQNKVLIGQNEEIIELLKDNFNG